MAEEVMAAATEVAAGKTNSKLFFCVFHLDESYIVMLLFLVLATMVAAAVEAATVVAAGKHVFLF